MFNSQSHCKNRKNAQKNTALAYNVLFFILFHDTLFEPAVAWRQIERIRKAVFSLDQMLERGSLFPGEPWKSRGLRRLFADNYCILYKINDATDTVDVIAILYSKRKIEDVLSQDER